jgi:hypothetical protein
MLALAPALSIACESQDEILRAALARIDANSQFDTIVLPADLSPQSRQAASHLRATIEQSGLTPAIDQELPNNYFRLNRIDTTENTATVYGTVGAILRPNPRNFFACGTGYVVSLIRNSHGQWVADKLFVENC